MVCDWYENIKICSKYLEYEENGIKKRITEIPSLDEFRDQVLSLDFMKFYNSIGGKKARDNRLEAYKIPAMVHTYYYLFVTTGSVPSVEEVCDAYIKKYVNVFSDGKTGALFKKYKPNGEDLAFNLKDLKGRICRAYNSWHRELDLLLHLIETHGNEFNFYYSFFDDYIKGVDIVAYDKKSNRFEFSTYFSSGISKEYKDIKNTLRHKYKVPQINVVAYFDGDDKNTINCGDAKLYDDDTITSIYGQLKEFERDMEDELPIVTKAVAEFLAF